MYKIMSTRRFIFGLFFICFGALGFAMPAGGSKSNDLTPDDQKALINLIQSMDAGLNEAILQDFDVLAKKYPDNYYVQYERAYNLYMLGRYKDVIKLKKKLLDNKDTSKAAYQLIGNAYDDSGDSKEAIKVYLDGIMRFPHSGSLYSELGMVYNRKAEYSEALEFYNRGILVDPDFATNYYRAANLCLMSENAKVWGLVYAETEILLAPSNEARHKEMAEKIVDCYKESISIKEENDSMTGLSVNLTPGREISIDTAKQVVYLGFPGIYEGAVGKSLWKFLHEKTPFTGSLSQLIEIRKGLVKNYFAITDNLYGNSMYLLEFQKKVIDAGHWDAYNYFLFLQCFPEEFVQWYEVNSDKFDEFVDWYNNDPFTLGDGRSVNPMQIFNNYRQIDFSEALEIQYKLLTEGELKESEE